MSVGPLYTWTCLDCPAWGERYWPAAELGAAEGAAELHVRACPGRGRTTVVGRTGPPHPEHAGVERRFGNYDPDEPLIVPLWAVVVARNVVGQLATAFEKPGTLGLGDELSTQLWAGTVSSAPDPDQPQPTTAAELASALRTAADALRSALPSM